MTFREAKTVPMGTTFEERVRAWKRSSSGTVREAKARRYFRPKRVQLYAKRVQARRARSRRNA